MGLEVTALWEALVTPWLEWQAARRPTSPCTSPCRARTGASPSPRLSDPLLLLSLTTLAPPTESVSVTELLEASATESVSDTVSLEESAMESELATASSVELDSVLEECTMATLATTEPPSSTLLSSVRKTSPQLCKRYLFYLMK